jgi:hypothetical protein
VHPNLLFQMKYPAELFRYILQIKSFQAWKERKQCIQIKINTILPCQYVTINYHSFITRITIIITPYWEFVVEECIAQIMHVKRILNLKISTRPKPLYLDIETIFPHNYTPSDDDYSFSDESSETHDSFYD